MTLFEELRDQYETFKIYGAKINQRLIYKTKKNILPKKSYKHLYGKIMSRNVTLYTVQYLAMNVDKGVLREKRKIVLFFYVFFVVQEKKNIMWVPCVSYSLFSISLIAKQGGCRVFFSTCLFHQFLLAISLISSTLLWYTWNNRNSGERERKEKFQKERRYFFCLAEEKS